MQRAALGAGAAAMVSHSTAAPAETRGRKVRWEEMLPDELLEAIAARPVCYVAYGLAEPHGPYCALGLDWIKAQEIVEQAAMRFGGVVAPPFAWHVQDRPAFDWLGAQGVRGPTLCSSIPADLWLRVVLHQIRVIDASGFRAALLITGHYGGPEHDLRLLCEYYLRRTNAPLRLFASDDADLIRLSGFGGDHAGVTETSQLMAIRPELVDLRRRAEGWPSGRWAGVDFSAAGGREPDAQTGRRLIEAQVERLGRVQDELLRQYRPREGYRAPSQTDADALWSRFEGLTRKYWRCSLTLDENAKGRFPDFPGWEALGE